MNFLTIGLIILGIIIFVVAFKILKSIVKAIFSALTILIVILLVIGVIFYVDTISLASSLKGPKEIFLEEDGNILAGASVSTTNIEVKELLKARFFTAYDDNGIIAAQTKFKEGNLLKDEKSLVILLNTDYLVEGQSLVLEDFEKELESHEIKEILLTETFQQATEVIFSGELTVEEEQKMMKELESNYNDVSELKADLMISTLAKQLKEKDKAYLLKGVKSEELELHPDFLSVKIYKYMPEVLTSLIIKEE